MTNFDKLIQILSRKHVYIQMHNYPDPDALSSAMGLQFLLKTRAIGSTICYKGRIDKYNTLKMIDKLFIKALSIQELTMCPEDEIILVDSQKGNMNVEDFIGKEIACIDHHTNQGEGLYEFADIRSNVGACASIIASYFMENNIKPDAETATALLYGLKMDTVNLSRDVSDLDIDMFCMLHKQADFKILRLFESSALQLADLAAYVKAITNLRIYNGVGIANVGNDCSEALIGTVSDFLLTLAEVNFTLVYSYRAGGVKFSSRSELPENDASKVIKKALEGVGDGGGHASMAAGFIPNIATEQQAMDTARFTAQKVVDILCGEA